MTKTLISFLALFSFIATSKAQELFFIGENSYSATQSFSLKSNANDNENDLKLQFIKDGSAASVVVSRISYEKTGFSNGLIIYLKNGVVIKSDEPKMSDYVDDYTKAVYELSSEEIADLMDSDIHTVRYTLKCNTCREGASSSEEGTWTASNKEIQTSRYIAEFFNHANSVAKKQPLEEIDGLAKTESTSLNEVGEVQPPKEKEQPVGDPYANVFYDVKNSKGSNMDYGLTGRTLKDRTVVQPACSRKGRVVVRIVVDQKGKVIDALPGVKGTTNKNRCLLEPAQKTALLYQWNEDPKAPSLQIGFVVVEF